MSNFINLFDIIYPVGSVYITFNETSPTDVIGGTWELLENTFLYGSAGITGITGGEETHKLTVNEMPAHHHEFRDGVWGWSVSAGFNSGGYSIGVSGGGGNTDTTANPVRGGSQAHNNMPPYITVHMYRRIV